VMVVFIVEVAGPNFEVFEEVLANFDVLVVDEGGEIVDVV